MSKSESIEELKENINNEMQNILPTTCGAVMGNFRSNLQKCKNKHTEMMVHPKNKTLI